jgi:hypothetical protein
MDQQLREQALIQWITELVMSREPQQLKIAALLTAIDVNLDAELAPYIQGKLEEQQAALQASLDALAPQVTAAEAATTAVLSKGASNATPAN